MRYGFGKAKAKMMDWIGKKDMVSLAGLDNTNIAGKQAMIGTVITVLRMDTKYKFEKGSDYTHTDFPASAVIRILRMSATKCFNDAQHYVVHWFLE